MMMDMWRTFSLLLWFPILFFLVLLHLFFFIPFYLLESETLFHYQISRI